MEPSTATTSQYSGPPPPPPPPSARQPKLPSTILVNRITEQIDWEKVENVIFNQRESLARFEKTNEMLTNCCTLSNNRLENAKREMVWYTQLITDTKKDLDSIFRRIRAFKKTMSQQYPEAFKKYEEAVAAHQRALNEEEEAAEHPHSSASQGGDNDSSKDGKQKEAINQRKQSIGIPTTPPDA